MEYNICRFHCLGEKLPDITKGKEEWYKIPVGRGNNACIILNFDPAVLSPSFTYIPFIWAGREEGRTKKVVKKGDPEEVHINFYRMQYEDQVKAVATAFEDLMIPSDKKTQANRGCGARRLRFKGASETAIAKFGCWLGIISKCAMQKYVYIQLYILT